MNRIFTLFLALTIPLLSIKAADTGHEVPGMKSIPATRTPNPPKIDGKTDDEAWNQAPAADRFITFEPTSGKHASQKTEVRLLYDDNAIYVSAILYDTAPDSILKELGPRDVGENNADIFAVGFDTYDDDQNAFVFMISASGVQTDQRFTQGNIDPVWDAVWKSEVKINDNGWSVEFEIPYSALRFPKKEVQTWGLNYMRIIRRIRETSFWSPMDQSVDGFVNQFGSISGLEEIKPPVRLSLTPYVSGYIDHYSPGVRNIGSPSSNYYVTGGADVKLGLNESFTLDMTLVPDFGQVQSDNQVLNVTPFEVQFQERRPFFTEGVELFNTAGIFYSRRVGGRPTGYMGAFQSLQPGEKVVSNPDEARILNAFKISGRSKSKTGLGFFNGITAPTDAIITHEDGGSREFRTQPLTNYNVAVIDQAFKGNSNASLINTNMYRFDHSYMANVTAGRFRLADKGNKYYAAGLGSVSQRFDESNQNPDLGHKFTANTGKSSGNFQFNLGHNTESHNYNPNDMGFLFNPNEFTWDAYFAYKVFKPYWKFLSSNTSIYISHQSLYKPRKFSSFNFNLDANFKFRSFNNVGFWLWSDLADSRDWFEGRVEGRVFNKPRATGGGAFISTNYAKPFAIDFWMGGNGRPEWGSAAHNMGLMPRWRVNNRLSFIHDLNTSLNWGDRGFTTFDPLGNSIIGIRNRHNVTNTFTTQYAFTNRLSINLRVRHYWARLDYLSFWELGPDGNLLSTTFKRNRDVNFNAFNVDCVFTWRFAPGSDLIIVWKNAILGSQEEVINNYFANLGSTFQSPMTNSLSMRLIYYLDYLRVRKWFVKKPNAG